MGARVFLAAVVAAAASNAVGFELVRAGKPAATIVVSEKAPPVERVAAAELQAILEKMSGAKLPIVAKTPGGPGPVVYVGLGTVQEAGGAVLAGAPLAQLQTDGYMAIVLNLQPPTLLLLGKEPRGTLYAVYDLLEGELECGFFVDGDNIRHRADVEIQPIALVASPAFADRACWMPLRLYGPKRFQPALWNAEDWKAFLRWVAKKKMNHVAVSFSGATRAWGAAFLKAFPEAKQAQQETLQVQGAAPSSYTARLGWGLNPEQVTATLKEAFDYARNSLGLEIVYVLPYGEFEVSLQKAYPNLKWNPAVPLDYPAVAGGIARLSSAEPKCRELQGRLWKAIIETYGTDHRYVVSNQDPPNPVATPAPLENSTPAAIEVLAAADPQARMLVPTWEAPQWGDTDAAKTAFIRQLPAGVAILYCQPNFSEDVLYVGTARFTDRPFIYACPWGGGASNDLFENRFAVLGNMFRHQEFWPRVAATTLPVREGLLPPALPDAPGVWDWNALLRVNPMMDSLTAEFAWNASYVWRGEGASTNRAVQRYLARRYAPAAVFPMAEAVKQALRGAPRPAVLVNTRAFGHPSDADFGGVGPSRAGIALALSCAPVAGASPFFDADLVDFGRNYLLRSIKEQWLRVLALVRDAKRAASTQGYSAQVKDQSLAQLQKLEASILAAHKTLTRIIATRKDMCLDDAILEAAATKGANKDLAKAIREQQSGLYAGAYGLVDSIEYHQQLKAAQIRFLLDYARRELNAPTADAVPSWEVFFKHGALDFVEKAQPVPYEKKAEKTPASRILQEFLETTE